MSKRVLVAGAGGFIGHHLVKRLKAEGYYVIGADVKLPEYEPTQANEFRVIDLRRREDADWACEGIDDVYQLAADMGGIGYITAHLASIARNNTLINLNMLDAARQMGVKRYLYTSSACVYNQSFQDSVNAAPLREGDASPALPEEGYGWEKLYAEKMTEWYRKDYDLDTRVVRFHNVYGPLGTYDGGKEKSPAALCRKIAKAEKSYPDEWRNTERNGKYNIDVWGDGQQTRTYMYIDDCVEGLRRIMESGYVHPINLGTDESISIDGLADMIGAIAGKKIYINHVAGPQGVRGRSSDNTLARKILSWEPQIPLAQGLIPTYRWISQEIQGGK